MRKRMFAAGIAALAIAVSTMVATMSAATADTVPTTAARAGGPTPNSRLPEAIRVDEKAFKVVETLFGAGKQVYECTGGTYTLREPVAGLFTLRGLPAGIHGKGPFWADFDGSRVDGSATNPPSSVSDPKVIGPGNVAWLKLIAKPTGTGGVLSNVAFIQRTDTRGGLAPTTCGAQTLSLDYTTFYVFWAPR